MQITTAQTFICSTSNIAGLAWAGDDEYALKTGDSIFLPTNVPHAFVQLREKGRLIVSYFPAGKMEAFFCSY